MAQGAIAGLKDPKILGLNITLCHCNFYSSRYCKFKAAAFQDKASKFLEIVSS